MSESKKSPPEKSYFGYFLSGVGVGVIVAFLYSEVLIPNYNKLSVKIWDGVSGDQLYIDYFYNNHQKKIYFKTQLTNVRIQVEQQYRVLLNVPSFSGKTITLEE